MKNKKTNVGSFATAKLQAKRRSLLAIIAMIAVIGFSMTACDLSSGSVGVATVPPPPPPDTSITYTSIDGDDNIYALEITDSAARAAYNPKDGDSYKLTITFADGTKATSTGTVKSFDPITFIFLLLCSTNEEFSVTISGNTIQSFDKDIPLDDGATKPKPGNLKPHVSGTVSGSYSYEDPSGLGSATITFSGGSSGTFTMDAIIFGMSLKASGTYTVAGNKITCTTTASNDTESIGDIDTFTIIDEKTLRDEDKGDLWIKK